MPIISRAMTAAWMLGLGLLPVLAQAPAPPAPPGPPAPQIVTSDTPLGSGPHRAIMEMDDSLPGHTIYRPSDLAAAGKLPLLVWGNGACANSGIAHRWFLADIASYGYLAIANGPIPPLRP
ncbi:MAG TPA: hypothetical protein VHM27_00140, partial [Rhizomicrobium sp.]|nr:hypothetical protein [Rhizomicrobium sp.]